MYEVTDDEVVIIVIAVGKRNRGLVYSKVEGVDRGNNPVSQVFIPC